MIDELHRCMVAARGLCLSLSQLRGNDAGPMAVPSANSKGAAPYCVRDMGPGTKNISIGGGYRSGEPGRQLRKWRSAA